MKYFRKSPQLWLLSSTLLFPSLLIYAQEDEESNEVFDLSPFQVDASEDVGYLASATTAGSRLNTQLKDVASSITVLTPEFLDDLGSLDLAEGLQMVAGAETWETSDETGVNSLNQGYTGGDFGDRNNSDGSVRVRGLGNAANAMNFIETIGAPDRYNIERSAFLRGPNSILFGLSRPAGLVNSTTKRALLYQNLNRLDLTVDNFGSHQTVLDVSRVIKEDVLGVRAVFKNTENRYMFENSFQHDKRIFLTATWKPFESTTITAFYEDQSDFGRKPNYRLPQDNVTGWLELWNQAQGSFTPEQIADNFYWDANADTTTGGSAPDSPDVTVTDFFTGEPFNPLLRQDLDGRNRPLMFYYANGDWQNPIDGIVTYAGATEPNGAQPAAIKRREFHRSNDPFENTDGFVDRQASDQGIFPWKDIDLSSLPGAFRKNDNSKKHINLEQKIADSLYLSATFQSEKNTYDQLFVPIAQQQQISLDVNTNLPDGRVNENFLRPFVYGRNIARFTDTEFDNTLVQLNYDLDFAEKFDGLGWLGFHRMTGFYSASEKDILTYRWGYSVLNQIDGVYTGGDNANRHTYQMWYVGDPVQPGDTSLRFTGFPDDVTSFIGRDYDFLYYVENANGTPGSWQLSPEKISATRNPFNNSLERSTVEASGYGASLQSFFWNRTIVTTLGWRKDDVDVFDWVNPNHDVNDPVDGTDRSYYTKPNSPTSAISEPTVTKGIVWHITPEIRVFAQESENFDLTSNRVDNLFRPIAPQNGTTEEYGIGFTLLENKLYAKLGFYSTKQNLANAGTSIARNRIPAFEGRVFNALENAGRLDEWFAVTGYGPDGPTTIQGSYIPELGPDGTQNVDDDGNPVFIGDPNTEYEASNSVSSTEDFFSEGYEFELTYNPNQNLRMHFNFGKVENEATNKQRPALDYIDYRSPFWGRFFAEGMKEDGTNNATPIEEQTNSQLLSEDFLDTMGNELLALIASNGIPNQGLSKYNAKITLGYNVTEGRLKGMTFGTNLRWEDGKALGYRLKDSTTSLGGLDNISTRVADLDDAFVGDSIIVGGVMAGYRRKIFDGKVDWRIQLNVKNLWNEGDLRVIALNPDRSPVYGISNPTTYQLSNSFRF